MKNLIPALVVLIAFSLLCSLPSEAGTISVTCPGQSLQAAVDAAQPGDIISLTGTCNENILVRNEKQRITIQQAVPGATVHGPDTTQPAINVRGKGILIRQLNISGGRSGVHVNRGSNATIDANDIDSDKYGILVDQESFAVITNNAIAGNFLAIHVDESSTVRIGYSLETDTSASPNNITGNFNGIMISGNSNAKIAGNVIVGNTLHGIIVVDQSRAVIGSNDIGNNGGDGIYIFNNSSVELADTPIPLLNPDFLYVANNSNAGKNGDVGVSCFNAGHVGGHLGTLGGNSGVKFISSGCQDTLVTP